jgi:cytochrome c peroxidase
MASTRACRIANLLLAVVLRRESQDLYLRVATARSRAGFTGTIGSTVQTRLGRPVNPKLANLGRLLFFDKIAALHSDNACAGCHSPTAGFGDTQSIAIGIQNNNLVGRNRSV